MRYFEKASQGYKDKSITVENKRNSNLRSRGSRNQRNYNITGITPNQKIHIESTLSNFIENFPNLRVCGSHIGFPKKTKTRRKKLNSQTDNNAKKSFCGDQSISFENKIGNEFLQEERTRLTKASESKKPSNAESTKTFTNRNSMETLHIQDLNSVEYDAIFSPHKQSVFRDNHSSNQNLDKNQTKNCFLLQGKPVEFHSQEKNNDSKSNSSIFEINYSDFVKDDDEIIELNYVDMVSSLQRSKLQEKKQNNIENPIRGRIDRGDQLNSKLKTMFCRQNAVSFAKSREKKEQVEKQNEINFGNHEAEQFQKAEESNNNLNFYLSKAAQLKNQQKKKMKHFRDMISTSPGGCLYLLACHVLSSLF